MKHDNTPKFDTLFQVQACKNIKSTQTQSYIKKLFKQDVAFDFFGKHDSFF